MTRAALAFSGVILSLLASFPAYSAECNAKTARATTRPMQYDYARGMEKAEAIFASVPATAEAILIGDSLVAFWPRDMAASQFHSDHIWNIGVGGAETQETLWLLNSIGGADLSPSQLFILVGTNNLTHETMPACAIAAGIEAVASAAHAKWPRAKVNVMGIPPRGSDFHFRDRDRQAVNDEVRAWGGALPWLHYFEVDADRMTCGQYAATGVKTADASGASAVHNRCANYADDFGHFMRPGYEVIFSAMTRK